MSPTTRAKKIKLEEDKELSSRINDLSQRLKNLEALNEINDFTNQPDSLCRSVRLQYSLIRTIVDVHNGQASISADETGSRFACKIVLRSITHRGAVRHQFILRYDYNDWKMMQTLVPEGAELMPNRE